MAQTLSIEHIEVTDQMGGQARIKGRRVTVGQIKVWHLEHGRTLEDIAADHDLTMAELHAAMAYYYDHARQIDDQLEDESRRSDTAKQALRSPLQDKLREHGLA